MDEAGSLINREEFFPFGETSFGSYLIKRYRFCGKERDEESGLYYYGARYYAPWCFRFVSVDPLAGKYPFYTPYQYAGNQPVNSVDLDGLEPDPQKSTTMQQANSAGGAPDLSAVPAAAFPSQPRLDLNATLSASSPYWAQHESIKSLQGRTTQGDLDQALKERWGKMSFAEKYASQNRYFSIINKERIDKGEAPLKTLNEAIGDAGEAGILGFGGVKSSGRWTFTGAWTPTPEKDYSAPYSYSPTLVKSNPKGPAELPKPGIRATQDVGVSVRSASGSVWSKPPNERGMIIEKNWGGEVGVGRNQPVIDRWESEYGIVTSIKSIDLTLPTYQKPSALKGLINSYIRALEGFNGSFFANVQIDGSQIKARILLIAVSPGATKAQTDAIMESIEYGGVRNINVRAEIYR